MNPIICLSGSMKQKEFMDSLAKSLTWKGCTVLFPVDMDSVLQSYPKQVRPKLIPFLMAGHFQRILLSDVLVAIRKKDGSFGEDTKKEVQFAEKYGRPVLSISSAAIPTTDDIQNAIAKSSKNSLADLSTILSEALSIMNNLDNVDEMWKANISNMLEELDKKVFTEFGVGRDAVTKAIKEVKKQDGN